MKKAQVRNARMGCNGLILDGIGARSIFKEIKNPFRCFELAVDDAIQMLLAVTEISGKIDLADLQVDHFLA